MSRAAVAASAQRDRWRTWSPFFLVCVAYGIVACLLIDLPGVYMDAVNPDYLVARVLNRHHADVVAWVMPGNLVFNDHWPVMITVYHGSHTFWLGLPFFWLFGTSVTGVRLTHAVFALGVLAGLYGLLTRTRLRPAQAAWTCVALAVDPAFSYAFRTQSYITLTPSLALFAGMALLFSRTPPTKRRWFSIGLLIVLPVAGYFIYAFYLPVLLPCVAQRIRATAVDARERWRFARHWLAGAALGASPCVVGYALAAYATRREGGLLAFLRAESSTLEAFGSPLGPGARLAHAWSMVEGAVQNAWHHSMMFGVMEPVPAATFKTALLVGLPVLLWIFCEVRGRATGPQRALVAMPVSFFVVALIFGGRLGGHHFVITLPVVYAALAVGLANALPEHGARAPRRTLALALPLAVVVAINVVGQAAEARVLARTRGVGLLSDAVNRFAADLNAARDKPQLFTPDWGLALPIVLLTRGEVPVDADRDARKARAALCAGRDVAVALIGGDRDARRREWQAAFGWEAPAVTPYRQADGTVVFDVSTFRGSAAAVTCVTPAAVGTAGAGPAAAR